MRIIFKGGDRIRKAYKSIFIKKNFMPAADNALLSQDIETYNRMMHTAFVWNNQDRVFPDDHSIHLHLKDQYHCNDYFANSANQEAKGKLRSLKELRSSYISDMKDDIRAITKKITGKQKYLGSLQATLDSIIIYTKGNYSNPAKIKSCPGVTFRPDGSVKWRCFHKTKIFDNIYLFEHQWLRPQIRKTATNISFMQHKIDRLKIKIISLQNDPRYHICFGTKKLYHDTRVCGQDRKNAIRKARYHRMQISGRSDSKNGNWVFSYDPVLQKLKYRSLNDWAHTIVFPGVRFPYRQDKISVFLAERRGAVAWEICDMGNAWQVTCIIEDTPEHIKNDYFGTGCVAFDMNYDNIAMAELDASANLLHHRILRFDLENKTSGQVEQLLSRALEDVFRYAANKRKPVVMENIRFLQRKKFYDWNTKRTRRISMFACNQMALLAASKSNKYCIEVVQVNPAYTSKTGLLKYKKRYGLSTHEAAAFVIGRRGMGFTDKVPDSWKRHLKPEHRTKPRYEQWKTLYAVLTKMNYRHLNQLLYPGLQPALNFMQPINYSHSDY